MKTFEDFHPLIASTLNGIAHEYGRKAHFYGATNEDFSQEMIAWLLDNESKIAARYDESVEQATSYVAKCLRNECKDYLASLKTQVTGESGEAQYDYGREELKVLLDLLLGGVRHDTPPEHLTLDTLDGVADVERVLGQLGNEDQAILTAFHRDDYSNKMLAEMYGISEANMSYRHNRSVLRLQRLLGGAQTAARDPWVGRKALSNSTARAINSNTYESGESA